MLTLYNVFFECILLSLRIVIKKCQAKSAKYQTFTTSNKLIKRNVCLRVISEPLSFFMEVNYLTGQVKKK